MDLETKQDKCSPFSKGFAHPKRVGWSDDRQVIKRQYLELVQVLSYQNGSWVEVGSLQFGDIFQLKSDVNKSTKEDPAQKDLVCLGFRWSERPLKIEILYHSYDDVPKSDELAGVGNQMFGGKEVLLSGMSTWQPTHSLRKIAEQGTVFYTHLEQYVKEEVAPQSVFKFHHEVLNISYVVPYGEVILIRGGNIPVRYLQTIASEVFVHMVEINDSPGINSVAREVHSLQHCKSFDDVLKMKNFVDSLVNVQRRSNKGKFKKVLLESASVLTLMKPEKQLPHVKLLCVH